MFQVVNNTDVYFYITITPMFDDLDQLAQRIRDLAARMKAQARTINELNQSIIDLRTDRDALRARLQDQTEKLVETESTLGVTQMKVDEALAKARVEQTQLQGTLDLFQQEHNALQVQAQSQVSELGRLRAINQTAQQRIEKVLEQLPGAQPTESV